MRKYGFTVHEPNGNPRIDKFGRNLWFRRSLDPLGSNRSEAGENLAPLRLASRGVAHETRLGRKHGSEKIEIINRIETRLWPSFLRFGRAACAAPSQATDGWPAR
jgi:hypothetical protein